MSSSPPHGSCCLPITVAPLELPLGPIQLLPGDGQAPLQEHEEALTVRGLTGRRCRRRRRLRRHRQRPAAKDPGVAPGQRKAQAVRTISLARLHSPEPGSLPRRPATAAPYRPGGALAEA